MVVYYGHCYLWSLSINIVEESNKLVSVTFQRSRQHIYFYDQRSQVVKKPVRVDTQFIGYAAKENPRSNGNSVRGSIYLK